jgi:hypothetical protein
MPFNHQEINITKTMNVYPPLEARPMKNTICLFDLDGTLCLEKQVRTNPSQLPIPGAQNDLLLIKITQTLFVEIGWLISI